MKTLSFGGFALFVLLSSAVAVGETQPVRVSTFSVDVTPPLGHPLLAGWRPPAKSIKTQLFAKGVVIQGSDKPIVIAALDWCELRNDAYDHWRDVIATAVGTTRARVILSCVHQHDTPYADLTAQTLLDQHGLKDAMFDVKFFHQAAANVAQAAKDSLAKTTRVTHIGTAETKVVDIACNRRVEIDGVVSFRRYSFTRDSKVRFTDDGEIDPMLCSITFWNGDQQIAALHSYATHPMSYYGRGEVSADFVGLARERVQRDNPDALQIYLTGCSGDVTAAKYNDGDEVGRVKLADRLYTAMKEGISKADRAEITKVSFHNGAIQLDPRIEGNLAPAVMQKTLKNKEASNRERIEAALGLSWQQRCKSGQLIDVPVVSFGDTCFLQLPAETFVAYQLKAKQLIPKKVLMCVGFGECAPGYIPTTKTEKEGFVREHGYSWADAKSEKNMMDGIRAAIGQ
jgi:hypothetical protein